MNVNLVVQNGPNRTRKIALRTSEIIIGRKRGSQVRIPSAAVSRSHTRLSVQDGYVTVEDLDSFNGTYLNGERVNGKRPVRPGDRLGVGPVTFLVEYELTQTALQALNQRFPSVVSQPVVEEEAQPVILAEPEDQPIGLAEPEEEPLAVDFLDDEPEELAEPILLSEDEILEEVHPLQSEEVAADFDDNAPWQLPNPDQLRDILKEMDKPKGGR
jgi:pSer/pThr/pTyr-binding forkhead associated (FHA) protein